MKLTSFKIPVASDWLTSNGLRLDSSPYLGGAYEARALLDQLPANRLQRLHQVTQDGKEGIINIGRIARNWVNDPTYGVPFLSSTDILQADLSHPSLIAKHVVDANPMLLLQEGWTLITRSGTIGRMAYTRSDMAGMACSEDVLRVIPESKIVPPGYLYAYLSSKFGIPLVVSGTYGGIIQHIEPSHVFDLKVPRLGDAVEAEADRLVREVAALRTAYQHKVQQATDLLFESVGLSDITAAEWHAQGPDLGFVHELGDWSSLRALNFNSRYQALVRKLEQVSHKPLGLICSGGVLRSGLRFKRIDCEPELGVRLVGQRELFWLEPEGRWISAEMAPNDIFVADETIMIAAQGTLGENEVFCRAEFITGSWLENVYSQHLLRVKPGPDQVSGAFLFAFLRSETAFRCLRSMSVGSKQQDLERGLLAELPVPLPDASVRREIEELIRDAYIGRHKASRLERMAILLIERAIEEAL